MDYYQLLGLQQTCSAAEIHHAFRELSRKMHPDRFDDKSRPRAEKEYQLIVKAYNRLKDDRQRKEYDKSLAPISGGGTTHDESNTEAQYQQAFKAGVSKLNQKQYDIASELLARAVFLKETAEAHFHKGMAEIHISRKRKDGFDSLLKATELDSFNGKYLKSYVKVMLEFRMSVRAKSVFDRLQQLLPDDPEVLNLADQISPGSSKKGGLLSSFFDRLRGDDS